MITVGGVRCPNQRVSQLRDGSDIGTSSVGCYRGGQPKLRTINRAPLRQC